MSEKYSHSYLYNILYNIFGVLNLVTSAAVGLYVTYTKFVVWARVDSLDKLSNKKFQSTKLLKNVHVSVNHSGTF